MTPCVTFCVYRRFGRTYRLHSQATVIYTDKDNVGSKGEEKLFPVYLVKLLVGQMLWFLLISFFLSIVCLGRVAQSV